MRKTRVEKKTYHPREDRYAEPLPLDPRELPYPFSIRRSSASTSRPR